MIRLPYRPSLVLLPLIGLALATAGCTPAGVAVGAGATTAVTASQERGLEGGASDTSIRATINYLWLQYSAEMFHQLNLQIYEGRVLLTGVVQSQEWRAEAVARAWRAEGVKEVIDDIVVDASGRTGTFARDQWITTQLKSKLLFDANVFSVNYSFETVRGVIYMLGVAQDQRELEIVLNHARNIEYVQRVVNHVILKDDPRRANDGNKPPTQSQTPQAQGTGSGAPASSSGTSTPDPVWPGETTAPTTASPAPAPTTSAPRSGGTIRSEPLN